MKFWHTEIVFNHIDNPTLGKIKTLFPIKYRKTRRLAAGKQISGVNAVATLNLPQKINLVWHGILTEAIQIHPTFFFYRITVKPSRQWWEIKAVAIVIKSCFSIEVLCREAMAEHTAHGAGLRERVTESIVSVLRDGIAVGIEITCDVTDIVVAGNERDTVDGEIK